MKVIDGVECYGELADNSNFHVVFVDEDDCDGGESVWCDGNPYSDDYIFSSWDEVVKVLKRAYGYAEIVEITAV